MRTYFYLPAKNILPSEIVYRKNAAVRTEITNIPIRVSLLIVILISLQDCYCSILYRHNERARVEFLYFGELRSCPVRGIGYTYYIFIYITRLDHGDFVAFENGSLSFMSFPEART